MTDEELNTALYKKMFAEQEKYREWLLGQPPEEVLNHSYEYTMREDILLSLEYDDIDGALAQALLASPCPLEDVFQAFESVEDGHMSAIRECIIDRAGKELEKQRTAPVYTQPPDYAREHGELDQYRESKRQNDMATIRLRRRCLARRHRAVRSRARGLRPRHDGQGKGL